jgi:hypothetical protein
MMSPCLPVALTCGTAPLPVVYAALDFLHEEVLPLRHIFWKARESSPLHCCIVASPLIAPKTLASGLQPFLAITVKSFLSISTPGY